MITIEGEYTNLTETLNSIAQTHIPQESAKPIQDYISASTKEDIERRRRWAKRNEKSYHVMQQLNKTIEKQLYKDRKLHILKTLREELDVHEHWAGIRALKKEYSPMPDNRKNRQGIVAAQGSRAETAAQYLHEDQWGHTNNDTENHLTNIPIITQQSENYTRYNTANITLEELTEILKRFKKIQGTRT